MENNIMEGDHERKRKNPHPGKIRRHSRMCPCREHIRTQTHYYAPLMQKLSQTDEKGRTKVLKECDPCFIRYLGKCACGILSANIKLKKRDYSSLKSAKGVLLNFANPHIGLEKKRALLERQSGSAFPFISILGGIASSLLGDLLFKKVNG